MSFRYALWFSIHEVDTWHISVEQFVTDVYDNGNTTLQYSGNWQSLYDAQIPSKATPKNYTQTSQSGASVALNFSGAAVAVHSSVNWGHWIYNVVRTRSPTMQNRPLNGRLI